MGAIKIKTVVFVIVNENFRDEELLIPREILEEKGHKCIIASDEYKEAIGMFKTKIMPDIEIKEIITQELDALVIIGGSGSLKLSENKDLLEKIKEAKSEDKLLCAICLGPTSLARAGVLKNKNATVFKSEIGLKILKENNVNYVDEEVVQDGKIITGNGPTSAQNFGKIIAKNLE